MIAIVDYGVGNLFSLASSLNFLGVENVVTADRNKIDDASAVILPGVGAFGDACKKLKEGGLVTVLERQVRAGKPLLGICLGMQLLFAESYEFGRHSGLGFIPGEVKPLADDLHGGVKVPHMGWNSLDFVNSSAIYRGVKPGEYVYFVHSYYAKCVEECVTATSAYGGVKVTASVQKGNVFGTQYHPEKSGAAGLKILKAFCEVR